MGLTYIPARIEGLSQHGEPYEANCLVDTGAIHCLAPASALRKAGICEEGRDVYELASGERVEYPFGFAFVTFQGERTVSKIIFGPEGVEPLIGVVALESCGFAVDPVTLKLKRAGALSLKRAA